MDFDFPFSNYDLSPTYSTKTDFRPDIHQVPMQVLSQHRDAKLLKRRLYIAYFGWGFRDYLSV